MLPEISRFELLEEERFRFEKAVSVHMEVSPEEIKKLRVGDGYGDRMYIVTMWWSWLVAVGLLEPVPRSQKNEHSIVDDYGQPL